MKSMKYVKSVAYWKILSHTYINNTKFKCNMEVILECNSQIFIENKRENMKFLNEEWATKKFQFWLRFFFLKLNSNEPRCEYI